MTLGRLGSDAVRRAAGAVGLTAAVLLVYSRLDRFWVAHDEGALGQSAVRILRGELPHRDFDALYTGGLELLHAATFALFGHDLWTLRLVLFACFLAWLPLVYLLGRRLAGRWGALLLTVLAAISSVGQWPSPLPSWYGLFLATAGVIALLRFHDTGRLRWLFIAGGATGLVMVLKIVGLYLLAAALFFVGFHLLMAEGTEGEPLPNPGEEIEDRGARKERFGVPLFFTGAGAAFLVLLHRLLSTRAGPSELTLLFAPPAFLTAALVATAWARPRAPLGREMRKLLPRVGLLVAGAALPTALFMIPYAVTGSLGDLYHGVFVVPQTRLRYVAGPLPPIGEALWGLAWWTPLVVSGFVRVRIRWWIAAGTAAFVGASALVLGPGVLAQEAEALVRPAVVVAAGWAAFLVVRAGAGGNRASDSPPRAKLVAVWAVVPTAVLWNLVQFPFPSDWYLFYLFPLTALALAAVVVATRTGPWPTAAIYGMVFLAWTGASLVNRTEEFTERLTLEGASLRAPPGTSARYEALLAAVDTLSGSEWIYATPDAAEVYYLTGKRNPTRTLFDFFDDDYEKPVERAARIAEKLRRHSVDLVVLKHDPRSFSEEPREPLLDTLVSRYPVWTTLDGFTLRWREEPSGMQVRPPVKEDPMARGSAALVTLVTEGEGRAPIVDEKTTPDRN